LTILIVLDYFNPWELLTKERCWFYNAPSGKSVICFFYNGMMNEKCVLKLERSHFYDGHFIDKLPFKNV
jgi:hypothetical protein